MLYYVKLSSAGCILLRETRRWAEAPLTDRTLRAKEGKDL